VSTLETLTVRFEADADAFFQSADALEKRLAAIKSASPVRLPLDLETRLTVAADGAISAALSGAGDTLAQAVRDHEVSFQSALSDDRRQLAAALESAVSRSVSNISVTIPVTVSGSTVTTAAVRSLRERMLSQGHY